MNAYLLLADERTPKHADTLADHANVEAVLSLEEIDDLLERRVILKSKAVPKSPLSTAVLLLLCLNWFREAEEGEREVDEAILEVLEL